MVLYMNWFCTWIKFTPCVRPRFNGKYFFDKVGLSQKKICSRKFNSVTKFHCHISATKVSEISKISLIFAVCERKLIAKVSVTNNLRQRKIVRGNQS